MREAAPVPRLRPAELGWATIAFAALTVLMTWPLAARLGREVPGDLGDPLFTSWILAWGAHGLGDPSSIFHAPMFHPSPLTLGISENLLGIAIPLAPLWYLTHDAALVNGFALLLAFTLNGVAAYALARELAIHPAGAAVAGFVFSFAPYRIAQMTHLHVEATYFVPLALLLLVRLVRRPTPWIGVGIGIALALQVWTSLNGGVVAAIGLLLAAPVALWAGRDRWRPVLGGLAVAGMVAAVAVVPVFIPFQRARDVYDIEPRVADAEQFSADLTSFLVVWRTDRLLADATSSLRTGAYSEKTLYPGIVVSVLAVVGAWRWRRRPVLLAGAAVVGGGALILAFGPRGYGVPLPYQWIADVAPLAGSLRVPTRVWPLVLLVLGILAARAVPPRMLLVAPLAVLLVADYAAVPVETARVPAVADGYAWVARQTGSVVELPALVAGRPASLVHETRALYRQTNHWRPLANGYSSHLPEPYLELMAELSSFPDAASRRALAERGVRWVIIHPRELRGTPWADLTGREAELDLRYRTRDLWVAAVE